MTIASSLIGKLWRLPARTNGVRIELGRRVVARDGAALVTDLFLPKISAAAPAILLRSPYGRGSILKLLARVFAERGYAVVLQSVRGTFGSEGTFNPFFQERDDGLDTVEWIERQPWYNGKLGLYGFSYLGFVHWAIAPELGARVSAISLDRTTADFPAAIREENGLRLEDFFSWVRALMMQERVNPFVEALRRMIFGDPLGRAYERLPLRTLDQDVIGQRVQFWRDWLDHDLDDDFWEPLRDRERLSKVTAPINLTAGWSDLFIGEQFKDYLALRDAGQTVRLTIDEGTHADRGSEGARLRSAFDWFDTHLKGLPSKGEVPADTRIWMNEEKAWRELSEWPSLQDGLTLYLGEDGNLSESFQSGQRDFRWSPADPTPSKEGPTLFARTGRGDMRSLASRDDVLSFTGSALDVPLDLLGQPFVELDISADAPAHDLFVCLCDVRPDGFATNMSDGYLRLPHDEPEARRNITIPLLPTGWQVQAGHRLQLLVAGGAFPRYARHLGTLDQIGSGTSMRDVNVILHSGSGCRIHLPIHP